MSSQSITKEIVTFDVRNVGGIDQTSVELRPGVNILSGENATNRTSFLRAVMAALGSDNVSIKGDAEEAEIEFNFQGATFQRTLKRINGDIAASGNPYMDDIELAELFAFLLESNEARQAVAKGDNLRDIIMSPVDLGEIHSEIARLESKKRRLDEEIEAIEDKKGEIPDLESKRSHLETKIAEIKEELSVKKEEIENADVDVETKREEQAEVEDKFEQLQEVRSDLEDVRYEIDTEQMTIQSLEEELADLDSELDQFSDKDSDNLQEIESEIQKLRKKKQQVESNISSLQSTIQFNEEMLESSRTDLSSALSPESSGSVTDKLLSDNKLTCWTCGSVVQENKIEQTLSELNSHRKEQFKKKRELDKNLEELKDKKNSINQQRQQREKIERRHTEVKKELEQSEDQLEKLREQRTDLRTQVEDLETEIESLESEQFDEILSLHREANELEYELGQNENNLESVEAKISKIEERIKEQSELKSERSKAEEELSELRTRVEQLEKSSVKEFNEHMDEVLAQLEYENIDRIWIERVRREVREGREKNIKTFFDLHVIRSTSSGTTYEDTVDHLSESEREVTGLVFALAGYLIHEVYDETPFMLLDSLEAIDSERIAKLVDYFSEYAEFLVVALLPEDANSLSESYHQIKMK